MQIVQISVFDLKIQRGDHIDGVPGTAFQKSPFWPLAGAFFAADALSVIHEDFAEGGGVLPILHQKHAFLHRAEFDAYRGPGAAGATFIDHGQVLGLSLPGGRSLFLNLWGHGEYYSFSSPARGGQPNSLRRLR